MVSILDYIASPFGASGFGLASNVDASAAVNLAKALEADYVIANPTNGGAMKLQSLEENLKYQTATKAEDFPFWAKIAKKKAFSTVEEFTRADSYGTQTGGFVQQTEVPPEADGTYTRAYANVKYIATLGAVTDVMASLYPAHGNVMALKLRERILWIMQRTNHYLYKGDSSLVLTGEGPEWDGIDAQIDSTAIFDCEGTRPLTQAVVEQVSVDAMNDFAKPTALLASTNAISDLNKTLYPQLRSNVPAGGDAGSAYEGMRTTAGKLAFMPDRFLAQRYAAPSPSASATSTQAPNAPSAVTTAVAGVDGDFFKGDSSGLTVDYAYAVTLGNRFGESAPTLMGAPQAVTLANKVAGVHIAVTVANNAVIGNYAPEYVAFYRTAPLTTGGATPATVSSYSLIGRFPVQSQAALGNTVVNDVNLYLPFTEQAYVMDFSSEVLEFKQLMPLMKADLAYTSLARRFWVGMFGTPICYAPKKLRRIINIPRLSA
jgi:hypothetical protein